MTNCRSILVTTTVVLLAAACFYRVQRTLTDPSGAGTLDARSPYLKAHLRSGYVYVLTEWHVDSASGSVRGRGRLLDPNRQPVGEGEFLLPRDSVALFETNVMRRTGATTALTVMAGVTAVVAGICASSPKTCFGSCPTFYVPDSAGESLQAEGFSSSIAPGLEATDVDMLYLARPRGRDFVVRMTNEALETHVIRWVDVLAAPRPEGGRVFVTPGGEFRAATVIGPPARCTAEDGDCEAAVWRFDGIERSSRADSVDLAAREWIELQFDSVPQGDIGLIITSRQTLLTTFLIYQALAYMGSEAGRWLSAIEAGGPAARDRAGALGRALGRIDVFVQDEAAGWTIVGSAGETGPLARDTKVVPLSAQRAGTLRVRLRLTRGLWRLDYVALASLGSTVQPVRLHPRVVRRDGREDPEALAALLDTARVLTTFPGDAYQIEYRLPPDVARTELFLEARGYYLEWMRREWMAEENQLLATQLLLNPERALRQLAPSFKQLEPSMDRLFWNSRYAHH
jgi:hypothetical protein